MEEIPMFKQALKWLSLVALVVAAPIFVSAQSQKSAPSDKSEKTTAAASGAEYLVISPHTPEECLNALQGVADIGKDVLAKYDWGCMSGDHTGYLKVQAKNEAEALKAVPASIRSKARAVKVVKFTPEQIEKAHESH